MRKIFVFMVFVLVLFGVGCSNQLQPGEYTTEINGAEIWYKVAGEGDQVLLVQAPPQGTGSEFLEKTMGPLEEDYTVVYYDVRGSGFSERDPDPETLNLGQFVEDLEALRVHLGINKFAIFGQSMGARMALNYAYKYPEHVTHLILTSAGVGEYPDHTPTMMGTLTAPEHLEAMVALGEMGNQSNDEEFNGWFLKVAPLYFWDLETAKKLLSQLSEDADMESFFTVSSTSDSYNEGYDNLAAIDIPTLVIAGRHDVWNPIEASENLVEAMPNAKLVVLENMNHMPTIDDPDTLFSNILEFTR